MTLSWVSETGTNTFDSDGWKRDLQGMGVRACGERSMCQGMAACRRAQMETVVDVSGVRGEADEHVRAKAVAGGGGRVRRWRKRGIGTTRCYGSRGPVAWGRCRALRSRHAGQTRRRPCCGAARRTVRQDGGAGRNNGSYGGRQCRRKLASGKQCQQVSARANSPCSRRRRGWEVKCRKGASLHGAPT